MLTDEKWLAFVLEQLLTNAVKYTPAGGEMQFSLAEEGGHAELLARGGAYARLWNAQQELEQYKRGDAV